MAKKAELVEKAKKLKLDVGNKNTIAELEAAIKATGEEPEPTQSVDQDRPLTKAGKHSAKAVKEAEEKAAKAERKAESEATETTEAKPKKIQKPARTRLERRGKKFREAAGQIEKGKTYSLAEAVELAAKTSPAKFDATVELHVRLNVDPKLADQNVRGTVVLPAGSGKTVRVAVFSDDKITGADLSGVEAIIKLLDKEQLDFDVLVATPANMAKLGKYARLLGPRGLMPNPKSGTVTTDVAKAVTEAKAGRVEFRVDSTGIIHLGIGKVSFGKDKLLDNAQATATSIKAAKPASIKAAYVKSCFLTTTMGPSIPTMLE